MSTVMDVRSGLRATLLALTLLWVGTSLPHMYSSARAFFLESLPSILSAAMAPKCLFIFSNIIVVFLVSESKLSRRRAKPLNTSNVTPATDSGGLLREAKEEEMMAVTEALLPTFSVVSNKEQENNLLMVIDEDHGSSKVNGGLPVMDHCDDEIDHSYLHQVYEAQGEVGEKGGEIDLILGGELREEEQQDECTSMQELQETDLPPADELNRRVEDFIARFNMERQLEAKMLVACY